MPTTMQSLEAALAAFTAPRAPKPALKPAADITKARGYSPALGAIYSPRSSVATMADQLEADGVVIVREHGMIRTRNAAERAADAAQATKWAAE